MKKYHFRSTTMFLFVLVVFFVIGYTSGHSAQKDIYQNELESLVTSYSEYCDSQKNVVVIDGEERKIGTGIASYYGDELQGNTTANGEVFDKNKLTAASRTLPFDSLILVRNPANGKSVVVRINDRGPFVDDRIIDLSEYAYSQVADITSGTTYVELIEL